MVKRNECVQSNEWQEPVRSDSDALSSTLLSLARAEASLARLQEARARALMAILIALLALLIAKTTLVVLAKDNSKR